MIEHGLVPDQKAFPEGEFGPGMGGDGHDEFVIDERPGRFMAPGSLEFTQIIFHTQGIGGLHRPDLLECFSPRSSTSRVSSRRSPGTRTGSFLWVDIMEGCETGPGCPAAGR